MMHGPPEKNRPAGGGAIEGVQHFKSNGAESTGVEFGGQPLARTRMTREQADVICTAIEDAILAIACEEAIYHGVGANFILEAIARAELYVLSNLTRRFDPPNSKATAA